MKEIKTRRFFRMKTRLTEDRKKKRIQNENRRVSFDDKHEKQADRTNIVGN